MIPDLPKNHRDLNCTLIGVLGCVGSLSSAVSDQYVIDTSMLEVQDQNILLKNPDVY
jgi:hypothetical protein